MKIKLVILMLVISLPCLLFSQQVQQYEYLTMTQRMHQIKISRINAPLEVVDISSELSEDKKEYFWDYRPLMIRINEFEKDGWELFSNQVYTDGASFQTSNYVLMRRRKL
ncbi:MAG: hypothetical protein R2813_01945 [Flavobacteriales bacterium]